MPLPEALGLPAASKSCGLSLFALRNVTLDRLEMSDFTIGCWRICSRRQLAKPSAELTMMATFNSAALLVGFEVFELVHCIYDMLLRYAEVHTCKEKELLRST